MSKTKVSREVTLDDVHCLENLVVAYNTVFLMSSIFVVVIASTARDLFSDISRILSPSLLLLIIGCFIVFLATLGYIGIAKKSSSLISLYTILLVFIFVMEMCAGFGIMSFRKEIRSMVSLKMKRAMHAYPYDPVTANLVDYVQLELECCGVNTFKEWEDIYDPNYPTACKISDISLPPSCCTYNTNSTLPIVNRKGCLNTVNFMLHRSSLALTTAVLIICTVQILGAYFSYSLASSLSKYKIQRTRNAEILPPPYDRAFEIMSSGTQSLSVPKGVKNSMQKDVM